MKTEVITFRLDLDSKPGQIYQRWIHEGYRPRALMQTALLALEGYEPQPSHEMSEAALSELQNVVERLESLVQNIQASGGTITSDQQRAIDDTLDPKFLNSMKQIVRPGFSKRPVGE